MVEIGSMHDWSNNPAKIMHAMIKNKYGYVNEVAFPQNILRAHKW